MLGTGLDSPSSGEGTLAISHDVTLVVQHVLGGKKAGLPQGKLDEALERPR